MNSAWLMILYAIIFIAFYAGLCMLANKLKNIYRKRKSNKINSIKNKSTHSSNNKDRYLVTSIKDSEDNESLKQDKCELYFRTWPNAIAAFDMFANDPRFYFVKCVDLLTGKSLRLFES